MEARPDVRARELVDEFFEKQDEPQYMRNVLSGLSGIMLVRGNLACRVENSKLAPYDSLCRQAASGRFELHNTSLQAPLLR